MAGKNGWFRAGGGGENRIQSHKARSQCRSEDWAIMCWIFAMSSGQREEDILQSEILPGPEGGWDDVARVKCCSPGAEQMR
mmetsp:Transcript_26896/g.77546  ORF Transcript_26896/g.77546 Transcript_26896/m.77546 type:complete len:81 (-) Transcript_26896:150-392(-)